MGRNFNTIRVHNDVVIKSSDSSDGKNILDCEKNFYKFIHKTSASNLFPTVYTYEPEFSMERLKGVHFNSSDISPILERLEVLYKSAECIHVSKDIFVREIWNETGIKILKRLEGLDIPIDSSIHSVLEKFKNILESYTPTPFYVIHGDLNFGNIIVDTHIRFIDPRGFFGTMKIYGPKEYDMAKLYFSLSGYDSLISTGQIIPVDTSRFKKGDFVTALMITIWLSAPKYLSHDKIKMVKSYHYGMYLASLYL